MTNFVKQGKRIIQIPKGSAYDLEPGKVYDLLLRTSWGEMQIKFEENGELNLPNNVFKTKKDDIFIKRILHNFNNDDKNTTGVLLTGDKGTGKSVTAKILAKEANLPIIIINPDTEERYLNDFFKEFDTPVCILFDEVDKGFNTRQMLTFLDGLQKTAKKLVIMTANNADEIDSFIKNRCSRIRYYRNYDMLRDAKEYAELICDAKGIENKDEVVKFIVNNIKYPSIDNICSFVDEIIFTKNWGLTLYEVLEFMNINVGEAVEPKEDDSQDCCEHFDDDDEWD